MVDTRSSLVPSFAATCGPPDLRVGLRISHYFYGLKPSEYGVLLVLFEVWPWVGCERRIFLIRVKSVGEQRPAKPRRRTRTLFS